MAKKLYEEANISAIAAAIRSKNGLSDTYAVSDMANAILSIPASALLASKTISQNGTYIALDDSCDGYDQVVVSVPSGGGGDDSLIKALEGRTTPLIVSNSSLSAIREYGFYNHRGITGIVFENVLEVGYSAFYSCSNLSIVSLPNCVEIKGYAFAGSCNAIRSISLDKLTSIGGNAFSSCAGITYVSAPLLSSIGTAAFYNCKNLSEIYIPSCTLIGQSAFINCSKITSIWLPNCSQIGSYGFSGCSILESIYLLSSNVVTIYSRTFWRTPLDDSSFLGRFGSVFVPESLVDIYKSQNYWSNISDRITAYIE